MKKKSFILFLILTTFLLASCLTMAGGNNSPYLSPVDDNSSGIYGYINVNIEVKGSLLGPKNPEPKWINVYFIPLSKYSEFEPNMGNTYFFGTYIKMNGFLASWNRESNTFFIMNQDGLTDFEPGDYGLLAIEVPVDSNTKETIWFTPKETPVTIKKGELSYWGAIDLNITRPVFGKSTIDVQNTSGMSKGNVLSIMELGLIERGWAQWVETEK